MKIKSVILFIILLKIVYCEGVQNEIESRGKKKKLLGLFIFWADLVLKKVFVMKLVFAFILWAIIHKAGYLLTWFVSYLKEKKQEHHEVHEHYDHHGPHHYYDYGPPPNYGPYRKICR